jgi:hypothetical protein
MIVTRSKQIPIYNLAKYKGIFILILPRLLEESTSHTVLFRQALQANLTGVTCS